MFGKKTFLVIMALLGLMLPALAGLKSESWPVPAKLQAYTVTRVVDGDTIVVEKLGKVRYIGVNAPEIARSGQAGELYGIEAAEANRRLVGGKQVKLEFDLGKRDKYGRLLAYVYSGSTFINAWLLEAGYAQVMTIQPNVKYVKSFIEFQKEAREGSRGLWSLPPVQPQGDAAVQEYWGNKKSHWFHKPWCQWAKKIKPDNLIFFKTHQDAQDAGYSACKACKP